MHRHRSGPNSTNSPYKMPKPRSKADVRQRPWIYDFTPWGRCDNRRPRRSMTQSARPAASAILLRSSLPRFLFKNPLHHAGADTQLSADLEDAITVRAFPDKIDHILSWSGMQRIRIGRSWSETRRWL